MGKEIVLFKSEERKDRQSVVSFLHQLADKLAEGEVTFRRGSQEITVKVPDSLILEIKVEEEDKKGRTQHSIEVELEWIEGDEAGLTLTLG